MSLYPHKNQGGGKAVLNKTKSNKNLHLLFWWKIVMRPRRNVGKFKRILWQRAEKVQRLMRSPLRIVQLGGHHRFGPCSAWSVLCWLNWKWFLSCWGCTHTRGHHLIFSFTQEVLHLPPTIDRVKANVMEKASKNSDPESPQNGVAAQHRRDSEATFPSLGEAWEGKICL